MAQNKTSEVVGTINHMKKRGSLKILIFALVVGIILLLIGGLGLFNDEEKTSDDNAEGNDRYGAFFEYKKTVENEIKGVCESVSGVSCVSVVAVFDGVGESIYAQNTQSGSSERVEYVVIGSGSSSHALYLGESLPKISGIGVVCRTNGNGNLRSELVALLSSTYGLPMTRIYVSEAD